MNKESIIKWVLIAGAAYLVYRYFAQLGQKPVQDQPSLPATSPADEAVPPAGEQDQLPPLSPDIAQALIAAAQAAGYDPYGTYNGYEWGWFWQRTPLYNGSPLGPEELGIGETDKVSLSEAVTVIRRLLPSPQGVSGVPLAMARAASVWSM